MGKVIRFIITGIKEHELHIPPAETLFFMFYFHNFIFSQNGIHMKDLYINNK